MTIRTSHPTHIEAVVSMGHPADSDSGPPPDLSELRENTDPSDLDPEGPLDDELATLELTFVGEEVVSLDDEEAQDLDIGISIEEPEGSENGSTGELIFDMKELLATVEDTIISDDGDGPVGDEASAFVSFDLAIETSCDDSGEFDDALVGVIDGTLPDMDADAGGGIGLEGDLQYSLDISDDPLPPWSEARWRESNSEIGEAIFCVAASASAILLCGTSAHWLDAQSGRASTNQVLPSRARSCAMLSDQVALIADARGTLLRAHRRDGAEPLPAQWRAQLRLRPHDPVALQLHGGNGCTPESILCLTNDGRLIRSADGGDRWSFIDLHGRLLCLDASNLPHIALLQGRRGRTLISTVDNGENWRVIEPTAELRDILADIPPKLAAIADCIAVAHPLRGMMLSSDAGRSFASVRGCNNVTAVCAGTIAEKPAFWAAVHEQAVGITHIVLLRAPDWQPLRIAELRGTTSGEHEPASSSVLDMIWHPDTQRLWAIGEFGAASLEPFSAPYSS